jgi:nitrogenase molybdenum-iron protein alpha/beta subunit
MSLVQRSSPPSLELLEDPPLRLVHERLAAAAKDAAIDLVVGSAHEAAMARALGLATIEFGFPCHGYQALVSSPYVGYEGVLVMAMRLLEAVSRAPR